MADATATPSLGTSFKKAADGIFGAVFNKHTLLHMGIMIGCMVFPMVASAAVAGSATLGDLGIQTLHMGKSMIAGLASVPSVGADIISNTLSGNFAASTSAMGSMAGMQHTVPQFVSAQTVADPQIQSFLGTVSDNLPVADDAMSLWPAKH